MPVPFHMPMLVVPPTGTLRPAIRYERTCASVATGSAPPARMKRELRMLNWEPEPVIDRDVSWLVDALLLSEIILSLPPVTLRPVPRRFFNSADPAPALVKTVPAPNVKAPESVSVLPDG